MSLDHYPILTDRRFQSNERSSYQIHDAISLAPTHWNYQSRSQNEIPHDYSNNPSSWNVNLLNNWSTEVMPSSSPVPSSSYSCPPVNLRHPPSGSYPHHSPYPDPSLRHLPQTSSPSLSSGLSSSQFERAGHLRSPSSTNTFKFDDASWGATIYTIDDRSTLSTSLPPQSVNTSPSAPASSRASSSRSPPVKLEPEDISSADCFVMEFATSIPASHDSTSLAPPTEVPLRATQASKAMRKMMGVFRLNPFSMHEGGGQAMSTWMGEEAGPLEEEPQIFEFQLDIGYRESDEDDDEQQQPPQLHSLIQVPEPELDPNTRWTDSDQSYPPISHTAWPTNDPPCSSYTLPSLRSYASHPHSPSLSSASSRKTPLDMSTSEYPSTYTLHGSATCGSSTDNLPSLSSMARRWSIPANLQAPFMI